MDGVYSSVFRPVELLDLVDQEWLSAALSDDGDSRRRFGSAFHLKLYAEIELPPEQVLAFEHYDDLSEQSLGSIRTR